MIVERSVSHPLDLANLLRVLGKSLWVIHDRLGVILILWLHQRTQPGPQRLVLSPLERSHGPFRNEPTPSAEGDLSYLAGRTWARGLCVRGRECEALGVWARVRGRGCGELSAWTYNRQRTNLNSITVTALRKYAE